jgi:DNA-binding NarL/FixJ family response regulator
MSVVDTRDYRERAQMAGADAFLSKDAEADELLREVRRLLRPPDAIARG